MKTTKTPAVAAALSVDDHQWQQRLDELITRIRPHFSRTEPARNAGALVLGLMSDLESKNCWTLAEHRGHSTPDRLQHLLSRAKWDDADVMGDVRDIAVGAFGADEAILVVDETGDLKKGTATVGVQRQYTGTAGRIENSQVAVCMTYAGSGGHTLIDRALYLPKSWTEDRHRCQRAGVPATTEFATKPALAAAMITNALDAGVPASWVAGDEVYGADPGLRSTLEQRRIGYVLGIGCNRTVTMATGPVRNDDLVTSLSARHWHTLSAGAGSKGERRYRWAWIDTNERPGCRSCSVLARLNNTTGELAYYRCYSPAPVTLADLVRVAGRRWTVEESFQTGKGVTGLDQHQVRTWTSWYRWTALVFLAHAFLAAMTTHARRADTSAHTRIRLSFEEFRRLFIALLLTPHPRRPPPHPLLVRLATKAPTNRPAMPPKGQVRLPLDPIYGRSTRLVEPHVLSTYRLLVNAAGYAQ